MKYPTGSCGEKVSSFREALRKDAKSLKEELYEHVKKVTEMVEGLPLCYEQPTTSSEQDSKQYVSTRLINLLKV
ncbi:MAG: hypothetical protein NPIRA02_00350 [Nitrospirales bacterium]|nr:MAG: hypothetical protein NPIRA02_00350 [Nitrospirales bacterium]